MLISSIFILVSRHHQNSAKLTDMSNNQVGIVETDMMAKVDSYADIKGGRGFLTDSGK